MSKILLWFVLLSMLAIMLIIIAIRIFSGFKKIKTGKKCEKDVVISNCVGMILEEEVKTADEKEFKPKNC